ncbi:hypothetical protein NS230_01370 [Methylobacterium indicum]|uniref:hypothetical protein n=1 Tax=Methylobacterium indicum TaxID=1775910 RepID=UPI0007343D4F|nr:hypothetical protein [Methylobacterium indicum]KTS37572.1 hypothetical protein NS229_06615 [Methylobacterium indicum]KTS54506.1 hypothetical protein NS230_01370 [Methylobacterium indicum]
MQHRIRTHRSRALAALAALAALGLSGAGLPALAETQNKTARPGERTFLDAFSHYFATQGCRSQAALVELVTPPRGGRLEQRRENRILGSIVGDDGRSARSADGCEAVRKDAMSLYYTPRPDFSGLDTLSVDVTFGDGTTVPYLFRITVPAPARREVPREVPAVSQAPARREAGQDAATTRAAPIPQGRAATAEDFLREAARTAAPASRPVPAAPLPKAASSTPEPAPAARPEVPQEVAPARPPRPPAQRQL